MAADYLKEFTINRKRGKFDFTPYSQSLMMMLNKKGAGVEWERAVSPHAQCRVPQLWLALQERASCLKSQLAISDKSFRQQWALQWRAQHSLGTKNGALVIKEADVKPRAGGWGGGRDDARREDMWYSFSKRKPRAKEYARLISAAFPALEPLGAWKPNCWGVFFPHTQDTPHTPSVSASHSWKEEQISKP